MEGLVYQYSIPHSQSPCVGPYLVDRSCTRTLSRGSTVARESSENRTRASEFSILDRNLDHSHSSFPFFMALSRTGQAQRRHSQGIERNFQPPWRAWPAGWGVVKVRVRERIIVPRGFPPTPRKQLCWRARSRGVRCAVIRRPSTISQQLAPTAAVAAVKAGRVVGGCCCCA